MYAEQKRAVDSDNYMNRTAAGMAKEGPVLGCGPMPAAPPQEPEINQALNRLAGAVQENNQLAHTLRERLGPVLVPAPEAVGNKASTNLSCSQLGRDVDEAAERVRATSENLRSMLSSLAI